MDFNLDYFLKINNMNGTTSKKDVQLYNIKTHVNDRFEDSIDFYTVKRNNNNQDFLIIRTNDENKKTIKSRPNEDFYVGDYINWQDKDWLVIKKDNGNQVYTSGKIQECTYAIKFQAPDATILSYPIINETSSGLGTKDGNIITVPNSVKIIKVPFDVNTNTLKEGRRIYIDKDTVNPRSYKITKVNNTEFNYGEKGLIKFTLEQTLNEEPTDRKDLGICNYFESTTPTPPIGDTYATIAISGSLIVGGKERKLTPTFYNADGTVNSSVTSVWTFDYGAMSSSDFTVRYDGNLAYIKVTNDDYDIVGNKLIVGVSDGNDGFVGSIEISIESGW